jgi:hypothetical protein
MREIIIIIRRRRRTSNWLHVNATLRVIMIGCSVRSHFLLAITNNFFPSIIDLLNADMNRVMPLRSMHVFGIAVVVVVVV